MNTIEKEKAGNAEIPERAYPTYELSGSNRVVDLKQGTITVPKSWGYYQYLILAIFPLILGRKFLENSESESVIRRLFQSHVEKNSTIGQTQGYQGSKGDLYLLYIASDLQLLYEKNLIPEEHLKRLRSENDGAMRGSLYELTIAAGFVRAGYAIKWLTADAHPEFTATKNGKELYVEAKRRDRSSTENYDVEHEFRALRKNFRKALKKHWTGQYVIFIDTDLPPTSSDKYSEILQKIADEIGSLPLKKIAIIITHNGNEHKPDDVDDGKTSTLIMQGSGSVEQAELKWIINNINARIPPSKGFQWN